jgi:hypothetical protein
LVDRANSYNSTSGVAAGLSPVGSSSLIDQPEERKQQQQQWGTGAPGAAAAACRGAEQRQSGDSSGRCLGPCDADVVAHTQDEGGVLRIETRGDAHRFCMTALLTSGVSCCCCCRGCFLVADDLHLTWNDENKRGNNAGLQANALGFGMPSGAAATSGFGSGSLSCASVGPVSSLQKQRDQASSGSTGASNMAGYGKLTPYRQLSGNASGTAAAAAANSGCTSAGAAALGSSAGGSLGLSNGQTSTVQGLGSLLAGRRQTNNSASASASPAAGSGRSGAYGTSGSSLGPLAAGPGLLGSGTDQQYQQQRGAYNTDVHSGAASHAYSSNRHSAGTHGSYGSSNVTGNAAASSLLPRSHHLVSAQQQQAQQPLPQLQRPLPAVAPVMQPQQKGAAGLGGLLGAAGTSLNNPSNIASSSKQMATGSGYQPSFGSSSSAAAVGQPGVAGMGPGPRGSAARRLSQPHHPQQQGGLQAPAPAAVFPPQPQPPLPACVTGLQQVLPGGAGVAGLPGAAAAVSAGGAAGLGAGLLASAGRLNPSGAHLVKPGFGAVSDWVGSSSSVPAGAAGSVGRRGSLADLQGSSAAAAAGGGSR